MNKQTSSILLIIKINKERLTYSIPRDKSYLDIYEYAVENNELKKEDVDKLVFFPETNRSAEEIMYYYDDEEESFDLKTPAIKSLIDRFRKERASLFKVLDMEFMRSLEQKDCEDCTDHIVKIKAHMRDMPDFLEEYLENFPEEKLKSFDCFNNVYDIVILNGGNGYEVPPLVSIEPPNGFGEGVQMEATAVVSEGKLVDVEVTQVGSGYVTAPKVEAEKSQSGNTAIIVASRPENDIISLVE